MYFPPTEILKIAYFLQPWARRAHRNPQNYIFLPKVGSNVKVPPSTSEGSVIKCSNCDEPMGASHQCGDFSSPKETVVENRSRTIKNLQKFCAVCEIFYKYGTHHQCETGKPEIVKCIVCQALGRETSLVLCGSTCPSCGVPANKLPIEL